MNVYTCKTFSGFYPVGSAAVVVAWDKRDAIRLLRDELKKRGLPGTNQDNQPLRGKDLVQVKTLKPSVDILLDGDY